MVGGSTCRTGNEHLCHPHLRSLSAWRCLKEGWGGGRSGSRLRPPHPPTVGGEQRDCSRASNSSGGVASAFPPCLCRGPNAASSPAPPPPAICVCQTSAKTTKKHHKNIENQPGEEEREPMLAPAVFGGRLSAPRGGEQRQTQLCSPSEGGGAWGEMLNIW